MDLCDCYDAKVGSFIENAIPGTMIKSTNAAKCRRIDFRMNSQVCQALIFWFAKYKN